MHKPRRRRKISPLPNKDKVPLHACASEWGLTLLEEGVVDPKRQDNSDNGVIQARDAAIIRRTFTDIGKCSGRLKCCEPAHESRDQLVHDFPPVIKESQKEGRIVLKEGWVTQGGAFRRRPRDNRGIEMTACSGRRCPSGLAQRFQHRRHIATGIG